MKTQISLFVAIMATVVTTGYSVGYVNNSPVSAYASTNAVTVSNDTEENSFNDDLNGAISTQVAMNARN